MDPVSMILGAASLAGAIFGGKRKQIDINWLKQKFGAGAVSAEALELFNNIINSPQGQSIMANAAEQGQQFQRNVNKGAAEAGLTGAGGASTGTGIFATSAAQGATDSFQRDARGQIFQSVLPAAQDIVKSRMDAYLGNLGGYQTPGAAMWEKVGNAAGVVGSMYTPGNKTSEAPMTGPLAPQFPNPIPGGEDRIKNALGVSRPMVPRFSRLQRYSPSSNSVLSNRY